ncbi:MAG: hypothetical protein P8X59_00860 [Woeseiaceae bacterium]|jgi:hypothetical protein
MNWEAIGAIGEIVGAAAVIVSLAYLGIQVRNQNIESRIASVHDVLEGFRTEISAFRNSELAELLGKGSVDYEALSDTEKIQFVAMIQGPLRFWEEAYHQYKAGRLSAQLWNGIHAQMRDFISTDGLQKVWELREHTYSQEFRDYVANIELGTYRVN